MKVTCPACGRALKAPDDSPGTRGRCPLCGTMIKLRSPAIAGAGKNAAVQERASALGSFAQKKDLPVQSPFDGLSALANGITEECSCPGCQAPMSKEAVFCIHCGFEFLSLAGPVERANPLLQGLV